MPVSSASSIPRGILALVSPWLQSAFYLTSSPTGTPLKFNFFWGKRFIIATFTALVKVPYTNEAFGKYLWDYVGLNSTWSGTSSKPNWCWLGSARAHEKTAPLGKIPFYLGTQRATCCHLHKSTAPQMNLGYGDEIPKLNETTPPN